jgi:hypothetical protein
MRSNIQRYLYCYEVCWSFNFNYCFLEGLAMGHIWLCYALILV